MFFKNNTMLTWLQPLLQAEMARMVQVPHGELQSWLEHVPDSPIPDIQPGESGRWVSRRWSK